MPHFKYKVRDNRGRGHTGVIEGESRESVALHFKKMGYIPTLIEPLASSMRKFMPWVRFLQRVDLDELIMFTRQLMTFQRAGVPILNSLDSICEQIMNRRFKRVVKEITYKVESGKSLSEALADFKDIFSEVYVNMVAAGEASGMLDIVLDRLGTMLEHEQELRMKIKQATRYPLLVLVSLSLAFILAVVFIIPRFTDLFARFNTELPLPTRMLLGLNFIIVNYWQLIVLGIIISVLGIRFFIHREIGRDLWDKIKLKVPVFGGLFLKIYMSRFSRMVSILSASGVPILSILEMVKVAVGNKVLSDSIEHIIEGVSEGEGLARPMSMSKLYPGIVIQMVKVGEETGKMDELLMHVSEYYDSQIDYAVRNIAVVIEPILIFVLGIIVLLLALAIFMPMWNLISVFRH